MANLSHRSGPCPATDWPTYIRMRPASSSLVVGHGSTLRGRAHILGNVVRAGAVDLWLRSVFAQSVSPTVPTDTAPVSRSPQSPHAAPLQPAHRSHLNRRQCLCRHRCRSPRTGRRHGDTSAHMRSVSVKIVCSILYIM